MASPVNTIVKHFHSGMVNAPVLTGAAGTLIALLDACLKDGFHSVGVTIVVASGVAMVSWSGPHAALVDTVVLIAGVAGGMTGATDLNGEQKVVARPSETSLTFATAVVDGTATGTITMKMAPGGFDKPFSGVNLAVYKSNDVTSTGCYLRVDDTGTQNARVVAYRSMSDVNTGVEPFPTAAQMSGGGYWPKATVAGATPVKWALFTDGLIFYLFVAAGIATSSANFNGSTRGFGDPVALRPEGDAYSCVLNYATLSLDTDGAFDVKGDSASGRMASPRNYTGLGTADLRPAWPYTGTIAAISGVDALFGPFPSEVDGTLRLSKRTVVTANGVPRSEPPGIYTCPQSGLFGTFRTADTVPGAGALLGRRLMALNSGSSFTVASSAINCGAAFIDVTGPWR